MKRLYIILPLLLLLLPCTTNAENRATRLLDKIVTPIESGKGISLKFLLQQSDMENVEGLIDMLSDKFVLQVPDMITWFDGTTQWTYLKSSEEVNISIPEKMSCYRPTLAFSCNPTKRLSTANSSKKGRRMRIIAYSQTTLGNNGNRNFRR